MPICDAIIFLGEWLTFARAVYTILMVLVGLLFRPMYKYAKNYNQKKVLSFNKREYGIVNCEYLWSDSNVKSNVVILEESQIAIKVAKALTKLGMSFSTLDSKSVSDNTNEICIGYSDRTDKYCNEYLQNFKRIENGYRYGLEDSEVFDGSENYAILIKLNKGDFGNVDKTVHMLFGWTLEQTLYSVDFFLEQYSLIHKAYKNKHYFFAIPIGNDSAISFSKRIDLTNMIISNKNK